MLDTFQNYYFFLYPPLNNILFYTIRFTKKKILNVLKKIAFKNAHQAIKRITVNGPSNAFEWNGVFLYKNWQRHCWIEMIKDGTLQHTSCIGCTKGWKFYQPKRLNNLERGRRSNLVSVFRMITRNRRKKKEYLYRFNFQLAFSGLVIGSSWL